MRSKLTFSLLIVFLMLCAQTFSQKKESKHPCAKEAIANLPNTFIIYAVGISSSEQMSKAKAINNAKQQSFEVIFSELRKYFVSNSSGALTIPSESLSKFSRSIAY